MTDASGRESEKLPPIFFFLGHMDQLFHPQGWDFHLKSIVDFGTAVRLRGFLGVGRFSGGSNPPLGNSADDDEPGRRLVFDRPRGTSRDLLRGAGRYL